MFSAKEIKNNLLGCFEVALFMKDGFSRFNPSRADAIKSFVPLLFLIPLALAGRVFLMEDYSASLVVFLYAPQTVLALAAFIWLVFVFCKQYDRSEHFYKFITVANWFNVIMMALIMPVLVCLFLGTHTPEQFESYAIFITMLGYVYTAYILTHVLRIPWELGAFVSIFGMFIDQTSLDIIAYIRDSIQTL